MDVFNGCFLVQLKKLNTYLKVTIEKKWRTKNFDFLSLKSSSLGKFLRSSNSHEDVIEFSKLLVTT